MKKSRFWISTTAAVLFIGSVVVLALWLSQRLLSDAKRAHEAPASPSDFHVSNVNPDLRRSDAADAIARFNIPEGFKIDLVTAEPLLVNPVSFCFDEHGRMFIAETGRLDAGAVDIRGHLDWLDEDLASRTVDDRVVLLESKLGDKTKEYRRNTDRIRKLEWSGSGADVRSTIFADGFNNLADGIGSGILVRGADVWYACVPNLWQLTTAGCDHADERRSLHWGYGIRIGYEGHDLHGLTFGPDGRLYFTMGDRGMHVIHAGRVISCHESGAVLRCEPDGSNLEIFATGLRNPQELAFDEHGNLFTCDNSSDIGEPARWVHVVEGGDSGWRVGYQFAQHPIQGGPWFAEKLWHTKETNTAAYLLPPIGHIATGPAGLTYHPGVALLPDRFRNHFFLADFCGSSGSSGIHYLANRPDGATFELAETGSFWWRVLATDVDFGPDGALYATDWTEGWAMPDKGRVYKLYDPDAPNRIECEQIKKLLADGVAGCSVDELAIRLAHADRRVRQGAQFALAESGEKARAVLENTAQVGKTRLARLHAIWALGQQGRKDPAALAVVLQLLDDTDDEIRAQSAKVIGDAKYGAAYDKLLLRLSDPSLRVRFNVAHALGQLGVGRDTAPILDMVRENADHDPYLRHAAVMALVGTRELKLLSSAENDASPAVRLAVLLAYRRLQSADVQRFLADADPRLVLEAARAIHDEPILDAMPRLAALFERTSLPALVWCRVVNANFRLGNAEALATVAARLDVPSPIRTQALDALAAWVAPPSRDWVTGSWRPIEPRDAGPAAEALRPHVQALLHDDSDLAQSAIRTVTALGVSEAAPGIQAAFSDARQPAPVRVAALRALRTLAADRLDNAIKQGLADMEPDVRMAACDLLVDLDASAVLAHLSTALNQGTVREMQHALQRLGQLKSEQADQLLHDCMDRLSAGQTPAAIQLDVVEAVNQRNSASLKAKLAAYEATVASHDALTRFRECLTGGDAQAGRQVFFGKPSVACSRCHRINQDGGTIGPDLSKIGAIRDRQHLLQSLVDPNAQITDGFETVQIELTDGASLTGIVRGEEGPYLKLITVDGESTSIAKTRIAAKRGVPSAMPADLINHLGKREIRDLVEFLANRK